MLTAREALDRLREGNARFAEGSATRAALAGLSPGSEAVGDQKPFAVILGCSDSRVPVELVFDQGPGDLFVIRVAGNVVAPSQVGSVEFAAEAIGTRLVVVLGHSQCGAVLATLDALERPSGMRSPHLPSILNRVRASVQPLVEAGGWTDHEDLVHRAVRANILAATDHLRHGSALLEEQEEHDGLLIVGAEYSLETGRVDFFDGVPEGW